MYWQPHSGLDFTILGAVLYFVIAPLVMAMRCFLDWDVLGTKTTEQFKSLTKREKKYQSILISVSIAFIFIFFVVIPTVYGIFKEK